MSAEVILSGVGLLLAAISLLISYNRASKDSVVKHEHRLTKIESSLFTEADRKCLQQLDTKMDFILPFYQKFTGIIESDFPKVFKHHHTQAFDLLIDKITQSGIQSLSEEETKTLDSMLGQEINDALKNEDAGRGAMLLLYRGLFELITEQSNCNCAKN